MSSHEQIQAWIAAYRDLDAEMRQRVDAHVATCEACAHVLADHEYADRALAGLNQPAPDASLRDTFYREIGWADEGEWDERRLRHLPTLLSAAAAVVAVVVLVGVLTVLLRGAPERTTQPYTSTTPTVVEFSFDGVTLASYRLNTAGIIPGEPLHVTLNWKNTVDERTERTVIVRLYDRAETLIAKSERRLTFSPKTPELTDFHEVSVPTDVSASAGPYRLTVAIDGVTSETETSLTELTLIMPKENFVVAGSVEEFRPGSVTPLMLDATFTDPWPRSVDIRQPAIVSGTSGVSVSPIPVWLVRDDQGAFRALYNRDPSSGCQVEYQERDERFIDPCYGADYSRQGELLEFTSPRGLDRFPVQMRDGEVLVDVGHLIFGSPAPHPPTPPAFATQETYVNRELGYAINYPPDWRVRNNGHLATLYDSDPAAGSGDSASVTIVPFMPPDIESSIFQFTETKDVSVLWKEEWELRDGIRAVRVQVADTQASEIALLVTAIDGQGLRLEGRGDLFAFDDIVRTLRPIETDTTPTPAPEPPATEAWDSAGLILTVPPYSAGDVTLTAARSNRAGSVRPGQRLRLRLLWSYAGQEQDSLSAFVDLTDFNDTVIAEAEREIQLSPDVANRVSVHEVPIPDDPETTYYQLRAGLIDTETDERLTFTNPETGEQTSSIPLDTLFVWQPERAPAEASFTETYINERLGYAIDYPPDWRVRESSGTSGIVSLSSYPPEEAPQRGGDFSPDQTRIEIVPMISRDRVAPSLETMVSRVENDDTVDVLWKEEWTLAGDVPAVRMQITGTLSGENALLVTVINDISLHIQGYGDLSPFDEVLRRLRPIAPDTTPTPASTETPMVDTTSWKTYRNEPAGYTVQVPARADVSNNDGCVVVSLGAGFVSFQAPDDTSPCGRTGVGAYDLTPITETLTVAGTTYTVEGFDIRDPDATPPLHEEHFSLTLEDGMRVQVGGGADEAGEVFEAYQTVRPLLLRIVESYRRISGTRGATTTGTVPATSQ